MAKVEVNSGVCGFKTIIEVESEDMQNAVINMKTECPNLKPMAEELKEIDSFQECFSKINESQVYKLAVKYCRHNACPVPSAIIKGIEVACGLALPRDVEMKISATP